MRQRLLFRSPLAACLFALGPLALGGRAQGESASADAASPNQVLLLRLGSRSLAGDWRTCEVSRNGAVRFEDSFEGEGTARLGPGALARLDKGLASCGLCGLAARSRKRLGRSKRFVSVELRSGPGEGCTFDLTWEAWQRYGGQCAARVAEALGQVRSQCPTCQWP